MRKNTNTFTVEGYLYEHSLEARVTGENSKTPGQEYIRGRVNVAVDEEGMNVVEVNFTYVTPIYAKSGKENPNFKVMKEIIDNNKTWVNVGKDQSVKVKVTGSLIANEFYNKEDDLVCAKTCDGSFIEIIPPSKEFGDRNKFKCDVILTGATVIEADEEKNIKEDYMNVSAYTFNFRNEIYPVQFVVRDKNGINFFENLDISGSNPVYTQIWGTLNGLTVINQKEEESAWGESEVVTFKNTSRTFDITGTKKVPYDLGDENVMTAEELQKAVQDRNVRLAEIKKRKEDYEKSKNAFAAAPTATAAPKVALGDFTF